MIRWPHIIQLADRCLFLPCGMTSPAMFVKTQQSPNHLAAENCGMPERLLRHIPDVFLFSRPLFFFSSRTLRFPPADGGQGLVKNSWAAVCVGEKRGLKKKKKKAITLQLWAFCLDLWLLIELRPSTAGPRPEDFIQLLGAKNTQPCCQHPKGNTSSLLLECTD